MVRPWHVCTQANKQHFSLNPDFFLLPCSDLGLLVLLLCVALFKNVSMGIFLAEFSVIILIPMSHTESTVAFAFTVI